MYKKLGRNYGTSFISDKFVYIGYYEPLEQHINKCLKLFLGREKSFRPSEAGGNSNDHRIVHFLTRVERLYQRNESLWHEPKASAVTSFDN